LRMINTSSWDDKRFGYLVTGWATYSI
jgi:hypothetical protein